MPFVLRLYPLGRSHPFDYRWVVHYDPSPLLRGEKEIILEVTEERAKAKRFASQEEAWNYWMRTAGTRPHDGKPNRPLTFWSASIEPE